MYWADMKRRITDEGFVEASARCRALKVPGPDGKLYASDCADFATTMTLLAFLPAWGRSQRECMDGESGEEIDLAGIYAITNRTTHEQYIGSTSNIPLRLKQHQALLRRGKHHARKLQEAWDRCGAENFRFELLERVADIQLLPSLEQRYFDHLQPTYNGADTAVNISAAVPMSVDRLRAVIVELYERSEPEMRSPLLRAIKEALISGALRPGPNFHLLMEAEETPVQIINLDAPRRAAYT